MTADYALPMAAMVFLTFAVCTKAAMDRVREIRHRRIPLSALARAVDTANTLQQTQAMDNFNNLLQLPVLFYVLCLALAQSDIHHWLFSGLLWCYVLLRGAHSAIQLTDNHVLHRARVWMVSSLVLCLGWILFVLHQITH